MQGVGTCSYESGEYAIDLEDGEPQWRLLELGAFTGIGSQSVMIPSRLDRVAVNASEEKPSWRILNVPRQLPKYAWGHSTCVVGGTRVLVLGGHTGEE
ncbi:hypothetical protein F0562_032516 [Nyssa sinensis]|uniref:Uncharacterized protein n=1 Tax=Nyssa sinensis TaxID=561372 RepID=A0A5J5AQ89_9ASTE|nr:hypothetical protein F0562_032516 [Nyssa sinensis]